MPWLAITILTPYAMAWAPCRASSMFSMPTSVGPMARAPKPPPPGTDWPVLVPSAASWTATVPASPLASVTSSVRVSVAFARPCWIAYRTERPVPMGGTSAVEDDDHLYVYGGVPPSTVEDAVTLAPAFVAVTFAVGEDPATAGSSR